VISVVPWQWKLPYRFLGLLRRVHSMKSGSTWYVRRESGRVLCLCFFFVVTLHAPRFFPIELTGQFSYNAAMSRTAMTPTSPHRSRGKDKRETIMKAAEKLFTSRRFHEITMDHVAAAAGVAKGTLYGHFRDKEDLFFQTCTSGFDQLCEIVTAASSPDAPFERGLVATCRKISQFMDRRHQLMVMMQSEDNRVSCCKGGIHDRWMEKRAGWWPRSRPCWPKGCPTEFSAATFAGGAGQRAAGIAPDAGPASGQRAAQHEAGRGHRRIVLPWACLPGSSGTQQRS